MSKFEPAAWMVAEDLAPGDRKCLVRGWQDLELEIVESPSSVSFEAAFGALWDEFGEAGELESREVLARRMSWDSSMPTDGYAMKYQMMLVRCGERIAAVTDQTAIRVSGSDDVIVHHSHLLVAPEWRRTGLAGWMRALPLMTARQTRAHAPERQNSVTIVAEMEHLDQHNPATFIRLAAMEKAGYRKVDNGCVSYFQPNFRPRAQADRGAQAPVPLALVLRRIGREEESIIRGSEIRRIVHALYHMYGLGLHEADMAAARKSLESYPGDEDVIRLVPPTA